MSAVDQQAKAVQAAAADAARAALAGDQARAQQLRDQYNHAQSQRPGGTR